MNNRPLFRPLGVVSQETNEMLERAHHRAWDYAQQYNASASCAEAYKNGALAVMLEEKIQEIRRLRARLED